MHASLSLSHTNTLTERERAPLHSSALLAWQHSTICTAPLGTEAIFSLTASLPLVFQALDCRWRTHCLMTSIQHTNTHFHHIEFFLSCGVTVAQEAERVVQWLECWRFKSCSIRVVLVPLSKTINPHCQCWKAALDQCKWMLCWSRRDFLAQSCCGYARCSPPSVWLGFEWIIGSM